MPAAFAKCQCLVPDHSPRFLTPAHRTRRADFPHRVLQWDHAFRTRAARALGSKVDGCRSRVRPQRAARLSTLPSRRPRRPPSQFTPRWTGCGWQQSLPSDSCPSLQQVMPPGSPAQTGVLGHATPEDCRTSTSFLTRGPFPRPALPGVSSVGSEEAPHGADLRPPHKRLVRFSRMRLSQRCPINASRIGTGVRDPQSRCSA